jgi:hypothetical protein
MHCHRNRAVEIEPRTAPLLLDIVLVSTAGIFPRAVECVMGETILFMLFLIPWGIFYVSQMIVYFKDIRFYRSVNYDLSRDSGNKMLFLEPLRRSIFFRHYRVGSLRLKMGASLFIIGLVLSGWMLLILSALIAKGLSEFFR